MFAEESLREGNLEESLAQLQEQVRKAPSNAKYRVFLFQLLAVMGDWARALNQLNVAGEMDPSTLAMVNTYREALHCEALRHSVFAGERSPLIFGEPEAWMALLLEALQLAASGHVAESQRAGEQAFEAAPATSGTLDGTAFEWIADADPRIGPMLETVVNGKYYWVPFQRIAAIRVEEPTDLRDVVWTPVQLTWVNGGEAVGFVPTRYPGSESSLDGAIRLARKTDWIAEAGDLYVGAGQRMLATDAGEYPLMDIREIRLDTAELQGKPAAPDAGSDAPSG